VPTPALAIGLPAELLASRPDVRRAELELGAAALDVDAARAAFFPRLELGASLGLQAFEPSRWLQVPESVAYGLFGGLVAPVFNRAPLEARLDAAAARQVEALMTYRRTVLEAVAEVSTQAEAVRRSEERLRLRQSQKAALERSVETADVLFRAGRATYLEVLLAREASVRAELALVDAWQANRLATVALYRALGGGWADLTADTPPYMSPRSSGSPAAPPTRRS
jgi:outer membrane protein TolC